MRRLYFALILALLSVGSVMAQGLFDFIPETGPVGRATRMYNVSVGVPGGFAFEKNPSPDLSIKQGFAVNLGYTTVFASLGQVSLASESEVSYRTNKESYLGNSEVSRATVQGQTGLGLYYNLGPKAAIYAKGFVGIHTNFSDTSYGGSLGSIFRVEGRGGLLYALSPNFSIFGEAGYGQDIARIGISIR